MTVQIEAKKVKPGTYIIIEDEPCVAKKLSISKPGKHGSAKARIEATGLFDNKLRVIIKTGSGLLSVPKIDKKVGQVLSVQGRKAQIMDLGSFETFDIDLIEGDNITEGTEVDYWEVDGRKLLKL